MKAYLYLFGAIFLEVSGTFLLPLSQNFTRTLPTLVLLLCYGGALYCLTVSLKTIPLSVVYATWSGLGVFTIALLGYIVFKQELSWLAILGLGLIVVGVTLVNGFNA